MVKVTKINNKKFKIQLNNLKYNVLLDDEYYKKLTSKMISKEELVKESFEFLLEREPKEAILKRFNLILIQHYFPEYENEMKCRNLYI